MPGAATVQNKFFTDRSYVTRQAFFLGESNAYCAVRYKESIKKFSFTLWRVRSSETQVAFVGTVLLSTS